MVPIGPSPSQSTGFSTKRLFSQMGMSWVYWRVTSSMKARPTPRAASSWPAGARTLKRIVVSCSSSSPGAPAKLDDAQRAWLAEIVERGPIPAVDGVVRWRAKDLVALIWQAFSISLSEDVVWKELRRLGFRYLSARPRHHAQDPQAIDDFKKVSDSAGRRSGPGLSRAGP